MVAGVKQCSSELASEAIELARALIRAPSMNPGGTEAAVANILATPLVDAGFAVDRHEFADGRTSLVARLVPSAPKGPPLVFAGHIDTVPLGAAGWSFDPFGGDIVDGRLCGRGSSDMKSGMATAVVAAAGAARRGKVGDGIMVVVCAGEETGCEGAAALAEAGLLSRARAIVVTEPTSNDVLIAHKGALWLRLVATGTTAHGSMPHLGQNAINRLIDAVEAVCALRIEGTHPLLGDVTRTLSQFHGGMNVNSVPDHAEATIDLRTVPGVDHASLIAEIRTAVRSVVDGSVQVEPIADLRPLDTLPDHPWVASVRDIAADVTGRGQPGGGVSYFTDASVLATAMGDAPTIVCGPGLAEQAHRTDEYCHVEDVRVSVELLGRILAAHVRETTA
jgi:succinyl-diaminopimelate desuccinylase